MDRISGRRATGFPPLGSPPLTTLKAASILSQSPDSTASKKRSTSPETSTLWRWARACTKSRRDWADCASLPATPSSADGFEAGEERNGRGKDFVRFTLVESPAPASPVLFLDATPGDPSW